MFTKADALRELRSMDHAFLFQPSIDAITEPFGFKAEGFKMYENPNEIKGLSLPHDSPHVQKDKRGYYARGLDAQVLAMKICHHLDIDYESKFGRGSQLRTCCDAIETYLNSRVEKSA